MNLNKAILIGRLIHYYIYPKTPQHQAHIAMQLDNTKRIA